MVKGRASGHPSERSERFEPLVRQPLISLQIVRICGLKKYQKSDGVRGTTIDLDVHSSRQPKFVSSLTFHLELV
ncbi:hypothetical protein PSEUDO8BK_30604 [Pseudomonas sp. 8BK]|nr:hypothetical protein PSEUDO8BK_30604 [Pseudomonas sp. 8BK]